VIKAFASPTSSFNSFATLRAAIARVPPYFLSSSCPFPNVRSKYSLDLEAMIFPFLSIRDIEIVSYHYWIKCSLLLFLQH
jgi:hypothetical protein